MYFIVGVIWIYRTSRQNGCSLKNFQFLLQKQFFQELIVLIIFMTKTIYHELTPLIYAMWRPTENHFLNTRQIKTALSMDKHVAEHRQKTLRTPHARFQILATSCSARRSEATWHANVIIRIDLVTRHPNTGRDPCWQTRCSFLRLNMFYMIKLTRRHHTHTGHERTLKLYYAHAHKEVKNAKKKKRKKLIHIISNAARTHTYTRAQKQFTMKK